MTRRFLMVLAPALMLLAACDGKTESAATPAVDSTAVAPAPVVVDSTVTAAGDSAVKVAGDSAAKKTMAAPAPAKGETGDYDKAIRPRFKIDEKTGKIDTIKRP
jgi:ABC-type Zn uptake system ZnuABC Zn-binding protein ZnuA